MQVRIWKRAALAALMLAPSGTLCAQGVPLITAEPPLAAATPYAPASGYQAMPSGGSSTTVVPSVPAVPTAAPTATPAQLAPAAPMTGSPYHTTTIGQPLAGGQMVVTPQGTTPMPAATSSSQPIVGQPMMGRHPGHYSQTDPSYIAPVPADAQYNGMGAEQEPPRRWWRFWRR